MKNEEKGLYQETLDRFKNAKPIDVVMDDNIEKKRVYDDLATSISEVANQEAKSNSNQEQSLQESSDLNEQPSELQELDDEISPAIIDKANIGRTTDVYISKLNRNNNIKITFEYIELLKKLPSKTQVPYVERCFDYMNQKHLVINYFDLNELWSHITTRDIPISARYFEQKKKLDDTYLYSIFDKEKTKSSELLYQIRKDLVSAYQKKKRTDIPKFRLKRILKKGDEIELHKVFNRIYGNKPIETLQDAESVLITIKNYLMSYPEEQSAIILYLYICFIYDIDPKIVNNEITTEWYGEVNKVKIDLEKLYNHRLPYKCYYLAVVHYSLGNIDEAIKYLQMEKDMFFEDWDLVMCNFALKYSNKIDIDSKMMPKDEKDRKQKELLFKGAIIIVIYIVFMLLKFH